MNADWKIPRAGLFWLIATYVCVIALHFQHLPVWISIIVVITIAWRIQLYRGVWSSAGRIIRVTLALLCVTGLFLTYGSLIGLEPMVAMLTSAFSLKLLELKKRRDAVVVIYLALFISALQALFEQTILTAVAISGCILVIISAQVALHSTRPQGALYQPIKTATSLILQSIPLMLVLFVVMPRLGALWSVPINNHSAKTGVSDTMSPGDFSKLGQSADVAFRVTFETETPPQHQLYWRGLVLSNFDGRTWENAGPEGFAPGHQLQWFGRKKQPWDNLVERHGNPVEYNVIIEPTQQVWLYALSTPLPESGSVAFTRDFRLLADQPISSKTRYQAKSWLDNKLNPEYLNQQRRAIELSLPRGYNPRTRALVQQWRKDGDDDKTVIRRALNFFNASFIYTLEPPLLGKHSVDEFLFDTQRGFCEHYASSFVVMMRAAGIPARVVAGYQGGERHPEENYWLIRQYDAHAWAEVWLPGEGWIRVDPTAAVAPERIESSLADILGREANFLADSPFSLMQFRHIGWINSLRFRMDALNYAWAKWVLGYNHQQEHFLKSWLGNTSPTRIALFLLISGGLIIVFIALLQLRHTAIKQHQAIDRLYLKFCEKMSKAGISRTVGEGASDYASRVAAQRPDLAEPVGIISEDYERIRYKVGQMNLEDYQRFKRHIAQLKIRKQNK